VHQSKNINLIAKTFSRSNVEKNAIKYLNDKKQKILLSCIVVVKDSLESKF